MQMPAEDDPLRRVMTWIAAAASPGSSTVGLANQNDPRLVPLFDRLKAAPNAEAAACGKGWNDLLTGAIYGPLDSM